MGYERTVYQNNTVVDAAEMLNKMDAGIYEVYKELQGDIKWENDKTDDVFIAMTTIISCERVIKSYEIIFMAANSMKQVITTGKIPINTESYLQMLNTHVYWRIGKVEQNGGDATFRISDCTRRTIASTPASSTQNGFVIPWKLKLYYE